MKTNKWVRRHLPCHPYDVEGIESWLTDMAQKGYILKSQPMRFGCLYFEKTEPQNISYRLEASPVGEGCWNDAGEPEETAKELNEKYGWEFVIKCGAFYIYRSLKPHTRELNTDPKVQAYSLKILVKKSLWKLVPVVLCIALISSSFAKNGILTLIETSSLTSIILTAILIIHLTSVMFNIAHIKKLQNLLIKNGSLDHRKKAKKPAFFYWSETTWVMLAVFFAAIAAYMFIPPSASSENHINDVPFATVKDFLQNESDSPNPVTTDTFSTDFGHWRSLLSNKNIYWYESTQKTDKFHDVTLASCEFTASYHEMINESLARQTAEDYYIRDNRKNTTKKLNINDIDADYVKVYLNPSRTVTVIIQKQNKVIHAIFFRNPVTDNSSYLDSWIKTLADSI